MAKKNTGYEDEIITGLFKQWLNRLPKDEADEIVEFINFRTKCKVFSPKILTGQDAPKMFEYMRLAGDFDTQVVVYGLIKGYDLRKKRQKVKAEKDVKGLRQLIERRR